MELRIERLTKQYGRKTAVAELDLTLHRGVYGLLGANGAGKTTLMRLLCDIQVPTSGEIFYDDQEIHGMGEGYRNLLGYLPQDFGYYPDFTAYKFMLYMSAIKGLSRGYARQRSLELLETVGLKEVKDKKIRTFSGGMKQRLGIAQAVLNDPRILILDEPTAGLDPRERVRFRNLISSFAADKIVLLSTHIVSDVEYIAGEILVMKAGALVHRGRPEVILKEIQGKVWECRVPTDTVQRVQSRFNVGNLRNEGEQTVVRIISEERPELRDGDHILTEVRETAPNLEDLYLYYFNEQAEKCLL